MSTRTKTKTKIERETEIVGKEIIKRKIERGIETVKIEGIEIMTVKGDLKPMVTLQRMKSPKKIL